MKMYIIITFLFAIVIFSAITVMIYCIYGWRGAIAYLLLANLYLTPAALKAIEIFKREKGGQT